MNFDALMKEIDVFYSQLVNDVYEEKPLSEHALADLKYANIPIRNDVYLQDYLRCMSIASIYAYHNHLRSALLSKAQVDIGGFESSATD